jgi:chromosomal replication initiation ATPase DnaA
VTGQLAFDLPLRPALGREAFFAAPSNAAALAAVEALARGTGGRLVLAGPAGAGKTHLAHVFAQASGAPVLAAARLADADLPDLSRGAVAVEDADRLLGDASAERALLHLCNMATEAGGRLLITGTGAPSLWGIGLPDLASRLIAAQLAMLEPPCDRLLAALLAKLFADRQLAVTPAVITFLVPRMERSAAFARDMVARLDALALARRQAITVRLAAEVLGAKGEEGAAEGA